MESKGGKMIICKLCKRQTKSKEPTGKFRTMVYINPDNKAEGKRIFEEKIVCMNCVGSVY